jgi:hypothetical protein
MTVFALQIIKNSANDDALYTSHLSQVITIYGNVFALIH